MEKTEQNLNICTSKIKLNTIFDNHGFSYNIKMVKEDMKNKRKTYNDEI